MNLLARNLRVILHQRRYRAELAGAERLLRSAAGDSAQPGSARSDGLAARLRGYLSSESWEVRNCALKVIATARCEQLYPLLIATLADRTEAGIARRNCAELVLALRLRSPDAIRVLRQGLHDRYWEVRAESAHALAELADESAELERELLDVLRCEDNVEAAGSMAEALGGIGASREAFEALVALAEEGPWLVRYQAAVALAEMAARQAGLAADAVRALRRLDLLTEGTATTSVFQQRVLELIELTGDGRPFPTADSLRARYLHLKKGWLK